MRVERLLIRLKREFLKVNLMQACLDTLIFFLSSNLILFLLSLEITDRYSNAIILGALSVVFFTADFILRSKTYKLEIYEQKNPELREILRTARDNLDSHNIVSQSLFDELMDRSRSVTSESIVPSKRIIQKILAVGLLSFLTVISGIANFQVLEDQGQILDDLGPVGDIINQGDEDEQSEIKNASEIYGEKQDIQVSDRLVGYNITGTGQSSSDGLGTERSEPEDVTLDAAGPEGSEDLELAKQYSLEIKTLN